jgi:molybdopterin-guanine dinucleotide biosynthesis protein A
MRGKVAVVILAGGEGRRLGGVQKGLVQLAGRPLVDHVLARLRGQAEIIAVSANGLGDTLPVPIIGDHHADRRGPLAGVLAGLDWCRVTHPELRTVVTVSVDSPFLPRDLVERLTAETADIVYAVSGGRDHPTAAAWNVSLADALRTTVEVNGDLSVRRFWRGHTTAACDFPATPIDPFFNINTPEDLARAEDAIAMGEDLEPILPRDADERHADGLGLPHRQERRR